MIVLLIVLIIMILIIVFLYRLGKKVKERERLYQNMFKEQEIKRKFLNYHRKSTPKVPTIDK
jgi:hypothetical protein